MPTLEFPKIIVKIDNWCRFSFCCTHMWITLLIQKIRLYVFLLLLSSEYWVSQSVSMWFKCLDYESRRLTYYCFVFGFIFEISNISRTDRHRGSYVARVHDSLLRRVLRGEKYLKLYSYHYLINGFAVLVTPQQVSC